LEDLSANLSRISSILRPEGLSFVGLHSSHREKHPRFDSFGAPNSFIDTEAILDCAARHLQRFTESLYSLGRFVLMLSLSFSPQR
jgi:hypothetical protein